ncbi:MAG: WecB/TagA/CpsF family glycosyltransferase [Bacteroidota bacterium]|nr:WecB/TagA/CpsF family glycosyltransferase [Bacteroidota bacterium]
MYNNADIVLCDGVAILCASYLLKIPLKQRLTGLDVMPVYLEECARKGYRVFFFGAKDGGVDELQRKIFKKLPALQIAGIYTPPYAERFSDAANEKIISLINSCKPDVVWVSLTAPKQDIWIYENISKLETYIVIGVGGTFEVTAGLIKRAPKFFQRTGQEWFYRFIKEPRRLFVRYSIEAPSFFPLLIKEIIRR